jgi:hypothetical protein
MRRRKVMAELEQVEYVHDIEREVSVVARTVSHSSGDSETSLEWHCTRCGDLISATDADVPPSNCRGGIGSLCGRRSV